jgi:hypothetical protein
MALPSDAQGIHRPVRFLTRTSSPFGSLVQPLQPPAKTLESRPSVRLLIQRPNPIGIHDDHRKPSLARAQNCYVISTDKSALLWMYCREIAPFETPTFSKKSHTGAGG